METVSTVFRTRSHKAVETAWSRIASTHRAEAGANERLQESGMRPLAPEFCRQPAQDAHWR
jgi:hypothetical protein